MTQSLLDQGVVRGWDVRKTALVFHVGRDKSFLPQSSQRRSNSVHKQCSSCQEFRKPGSVLIWILAFCLLCPNVVFARTAHDKASVCLGKVRLGLGIAEPSSIGFF
jgi:hypothetical protein